MRKRKHPVRLSSAWLLRSSRLVALAFLSIAVVAASSANASVVLKNDFTGTGALKLKMEFFHDQYVQCTSSVIKGTVSKPADAKATITSWATEGCSIFRDSKNLGSATVKISTLPTVEAASSTGVYLGSFIAKATYKIGSATCNPEFKIGSSLANYSSGPTTNQLTDFTASEFVDWTPFLPEACLFSGGEWIEANFNFNHPQFEVVETVSPPPSATFSLRNTNSTGSADVSFTYELATDKPLAGDWNGNGVATIGVHRSGSFYLRNSNTSGSPDVTASFGNSDDHPIVGDWDGDGDDTIGVYRPSNRTFYLRNSNSNGAADVAVDFGNFGDVPIVGDWDGDGDDTIGVYRPGSSSFYLRNSNSNGTADISANFGNIGDVPVIGDWDGDGDDTIGTFR
jgi:hypothetical protein